jgi:outer membrane immunogenic protein
MLRPGDSLFGASGLCCAVVDLDLGRGSAGMKFKSLLAAAAAAAVAFCTQAHAADVAPLPYYKEPPPYMLYNWTGFYVGVHFGGAFGVESESLLGGNFSTNPSGVLGGVQLGYNYQFSPNLLVGVETELSWTSATGNVTAAFPGIAAALNSSHNWYDTLAARLGYVQNNWLFYAKLGPAWMNADYAMSVAGLGTSSFNATRAGFMVGVGAEYAFNPNWSAKIEYSFLDFGTDNFAYAFAGVGVPTNIDTQVHEVKVGVNYHFQPGGLFGRW